MRAPDPELPLKTLGQLAQGDQTPTLVRFVGFYALGSDPVCPVCPGEAMCEEC